MTTCITSATLAMLLIVLLSATIHPMRVEAEEITAVPKGQVSTSVWIDENCDSVNDASELPLTSTQIVQFVNTGNDHTLTIGDRGQTFYTDAKGVWVSNLIGIIGDDGLPYTLVVAIGPGSAASLGYKPSPPGRDNILSGPPFYASPPFSLQDGVTLELGPIGVCRLDFGLNHKIYLPLAQHQ